MIRETFGRRGATAFTYGMFNSAILLRGEESGGAIALVEVTVPAGWDGPPLHHHDFDEAFHVLQGELTFQLGEELRTGTAGQSVFARGGDVHTLANRSDAVARYLLAITPAGFERRFDGSGPVPETTVVGPAIDASAPATPLPDPALRVNVLVRHADSDGRVSMMDNVVRPGGGPPLHHHDFDELFYVLDGELTFQLGDERHVRRAGELAFAPRGAVHTFANFSGAPARQLLFVTPAGFERYFQRIAAEIAGVEPPPEALEPIPEVTKVGPPLSA
jgi:quercetin dioxygenase-like cupin family protein